MSTTKVKRSPRPAPAPIPVTARSGPIVTWAEQAECTCPEHCERDHERD